MQPKKASPKKKRPKWATQDQQLTELRDLIGDQALRLLVENFGGERTYIPKSIQKRKTKDGTGPMTRMAVVLGEDAARKLAERYGGDYPSIPLARPFLARIYKEEGLSNSKIARRLGFTVSALVRLFQREKLKNARLIGNSNER